MEGAREGDMEGERERGRERGRAMGGYLQFQGSILLSERSALQRKPFDLAYEVESGLHVG